MFTWIIVLTLQSSEECLMYLNTSIEELVIASLHPDHAFVQVRGIQNIFGLESQIVPEIVK